MSATDCEDIFRNDELLTPNGVEVVHVGDIVQGRKTLCSHLALDHIALLYCVQGTVGVTLSDAGVRTLRSGDILIVFPGRFMSLEMRDSKSNRLMFLGLRGANAVTSVLWMGFWDLMQGNDPYQGDFLFSIINRFQTAPEHGRDAVLLGRVGQLLDIVWNRLYHGAGLCEFYAAVRVLNRLPFDGYTTEAAAETLGISRTKLNMLMLSNGMDRPGKYLARNRFMIAQAMLYFTHESTERIAVRLGFSSASAFGVFFRQQCGRTPNAFRRRPIAE